jgi:hypothetical protein
VPRRDGAPGRANGCEADAVVRRGAAAVVDHGEDVAWEVGPSPSEAAVAAVAGHWLVIAIKTDGVVLCRLARSIRDMLNQWAGRSF